MRSTLCFLTFCFTAMILFSCQKENAVTEKQVPKAVLERIADLGYSTKDVQAIEEGYLVEGDIILTQENLDDHADHLTLRIAETEQYRTTNLVTDLARTITVSIDPKLTVIPGYSQAYTTMINRYNSQNLQLTFQDVGSSGGEIHLKKQGGNFLASAGFPSGGDPYPLIKINSNALGSGNNSTFINFCASVMAHEVGHCIGFRHTDYMDRSFSCNTGGNEGSGGVGAIHIAGTPSGPDEDSWMLACTSLNLDRPFNANDKIALNAIY